VIVVICIVNAPLPVLEPVVSLSPNDSGGRGVHIINMENREFFMPRGIPLRTVYNADDLHRR
jgi:hypothetical protein